jgi:UDP-N-acetylglucosamine 2-epimerase (non-hydrolysing)
VIVFVYGTTAEAIKLAPVMRRLQDRGVRFEQWLTLQQADTVLHAVAQLGLPDPDLFIGKAPGDRPLSGLRDVLVWVLRMVSWFLRVGRRQRGRLRGGVIVVHGDTMTSVVGAVLARLLGIDCAHVEAGLRSGDWKNPFPEELDRRLVGVLAHVHYAPDGAAARALSRRANVVITQGNTVIDAVLDAAAGSDEAPAGRVSPLRDGEPYGVVLLHRYEFLTSGSVVDETFQTLEQSVPHAALVVLDDLARAHLDGRLASYARLRPVDKMPHARFTQVVAGAAFVVTDSGGVQEEAALLGVPTLVHRRTTERSDGLGHNVVLSRWESRAFEHFLADPEVYRRPPGTPAVSPSDVVVEDLLARGYGCGERSAP